MYRKNQRPNVLEIMEKRLDVGDIMQPVEGLAGLWARDKGWYDVLKVDVRNKLPQLLTLPLLPVSITWDGWRISDLRISQRAKTNDSLPAISQQQKFSPNKISENWKEVSESTHCVEFYDIADARECFLSRISSKEQSDMNAKPSGQSRSHPVPVRFRYSWTARAAAAAVAIQNFNRRSNCLGNGHIFKTNCFHPFSEFHFPRGKINRPAAAKSVNYCLVRWTGSLIWFKDPP